MRNLNIKSDRAYDLAHFLAKRAGKTVTAAILDMLEREKRLLTKDELLEKWTRIGAENRKRLDPAYLAEDHDAEMYDEWGSPK